MPVPTLITELSQTPATNSPPGSESPSSIDDYLRAHASFTALLRDSKADLASPTLTGTPSSTTPARFDRSTRIATMAAIGAEQGSLAGQLAINVSQAIAASNGGSEINASGTITLTLPVGAAVPAGAAFIINNSGTGIVTIVPTGSDVLKRIDAAAGNIVLGAGDATTIVFAGGTLFNARVFVADANKPLSTVASNSLGVRNVVFNGDFRVNQRVYASGAVLAAGVYGHDRFKSGASGGDYSFTQLNSSTQVTIATGKSLVQVVEDKNVFGGSYILSWVGTALGRVGVNTATPAGIFVVSPILITGQTAGTTMSFELNAGTVNTVQLEQGSVATPFERRPIGLELALCQRYTARITCVSNSSGSAFQNMFYPVSMRAIPTLSVASGSLGGPTLNSRGLSSFTIDGLSPAAVQVDILATAEL